MSKSFRIVVVALVVSAAGVIAYAQGAHPAVDACAKSKQGDTCSFTGKSGKDVKGTCQPPRRSRSGVSLVCRPEGMGGGSGSGSGHGSGSGSGGGHGTGSGSGGGHGTGSGSGGGHGTGSGSGSGH